ncbi:stage V sporulation protein B [Paenibacillus daejeonensis]|uniref:stage V sporulation protein B n=1 Tax=Paenibacillus daejeonensis TaxID=135193 RepID=UPI00035E1CA4|nr:stage V sporulation protein B [Paenibacillus daejeonensis]
MTKQTFIKGAMILLAAGIINRILGFIPRIALPRIIGAEGVGLFQLGYPFLIVMLTVITGGIPIAVAKWVAEAESLGDEHKVRQIFRTAIKLTLVLAVVFTAVTIALAPWISTHVLTDERVYYPFLFMTPMLLIAAISSVCRGYFQGRQNMIPSALSQVIETLFRIIFVLYFAQLFLPLGLEWAAAGAMIGAVIGEICGLLVLLFQLAQDRKRRQRLSGTPAEPVLKRLVGWSVPVTLSKMTGSLSYLFESILTVRALAVAGIATGAATAQYGALQGMIIPIVLLPTALTYSLSSSLVPSLSEAAARNDLATIRKRMHQTMRLALVSGAPFIVYMGMLAGPICSILYDYEEIAPMLRLIAPVALFIYLQAPLQAALQALDKPGTALRNTLVGAIIKLSLITLLASRPELGIYGVLIAMAVQIVIVTLLHWSSVIRLIGFHMKMLDFVKVGASMVIMGAAVKFSYAYPFPGGDWLQLLVALGGGMVVYLLLMVLLGIIDRDDLSRIPLIGRWVAK